MNKKISFPIAIIIIVVCAVLVGGLAVWQYLKIPAKTELPEIEISEFKPAEKTQPEDETADWKTYKNEKYGFEIKYPSEWKIDKEYFTGVTTIPEYKDFKLEILSPSMSKIRMSASKHFIGGKGTRLILKEEKKIDVGSILVTEKIWVDENNLLSFANTYDFSKLGQVLTVQDDEKSKDVFKYSGEIILNGDNDERENDLKVFNQMLSTFKFLE